jgi:two-component system, OmpR family, response regulator
MAGQLIYIADDEKNIRELIKTFLEREGFEVRAFADGLSLLKAFEAQAADMVILDVMMPGMDGYTLCSTVRAKSRAPIMIVSAKDGETDRIAGLMLGSDDYMVKPFSTVELVLRVKALLRRSERGEGKPAGNALEFGDLSVQPEGKKAECAGIDLGLTVMETDFLSYMVKNSGRAVSRDELLNRVWGFESEADTRATDDMVKRVRKKLAAAGSVVSIETVWGFGFKLARGNNP